MVWCEKMGQEWPTQDVDSFRRQGIIVATACWRNSVLIWAEIVLQHQQPQNRHSVRSTASGIASNHTKRRSVILMAIQVYSRDDNYVHKPHGQTQETTREKYHPRTKSWLRLFSTTLAAIHGFWTTGSTIQKLKRLAYALPKVTTFQPLAISKLNSKVNKVND